MRTIATGLRFPEGPVAMPDGSVLVVEVARGTITRVAPDGALSVVAEVGGGPNGLAVGPNGKLYCCNNGGFEWQEMMGMLVPGEQPASYTGGSIQRVDPTTGRVETLYTHCGKHQLRGPNDLVFDTHGGFWFTDHGKIRERERDRGGLYYARADGSLIREVVFPLDSPNGVGLSPDGSRLYVAETYTGRLWAFDVGAPGEIVPSAVLAGPGGGTLLAGLPGFQLFDSLAVEACGNVCVATLAAAAITVFAPDGTIVEQVPTADFITTNLCFGGPNLQTAYVTLSGTGQLAAFDWKRPGLRLAH
jgi:gluconolactonase